LATASLPSGIVAVDQSMTSGGAGGRRGAAQASGLVPRRRSRPPNGATVGSALQNASATRPSSASSSTHSPSRPTWFARRIAAALDDGRLGGRIDLAFADEPQVGDEPPHTVRVVPAQVRLHQRVGDHGGYCRRRARILQDGAGEVQQLPCALDPFHMTERDSFRWKLGRSFPRWTAA
jgi:hypothetical protein